MKMDLHNDIYVSTAIDPISSSDNTAVVSEILDCANFAINELIWQTGSIADADATFTVLLEEGAASNLSDAAAVADADMLGTEAGATPLFSDDNKVYKLGYTGSKRYIRVTITPAANTGAFLKSGVWVQGAARKSPFTTQGV